MLSTLLLLYGLAGGIGPAAPPPEALVPGIIHFGSDNTMPDVLSAPEIVRAGEEFKLTITTFGGGCDRQGQTSVMYSDQGASVMVYDITTATRPDVSCIAVAKRLPHTIALRFEKPGVALIRVWGRRVTSDTPAAGLPAVHERRVTIK